VSINRLLTTMAANGGMSFSNNFVVKFANIPEGAPKPPGADDYFEMFCSEAQLPNTNSAQGQTNGVYVGSGSVSYPHTRVYTEIQLGFMCDANMTALKFLQDWLDYIFSGDENYGEMGLKFSGKSKSEMKSAAHGPKKIENRSVRLKYRDQYACDIAITKTETGPNSPTERAPITYLLEQAYPYAIDAIPLQFGSSQITQVTAQFSYMRHHVIKNDIRSFNNTELKDLKDILGNGGILV